MRIVWFVIGCVFVTLGGIGILLPIMPTVPFLLIAVWAFFHSSPRLGVKIMRHPTYGPPIRAFYKYGVISRMAKLWAIVAMASSVIVAVLLKIDWRLVLIQAAVCSGVALWMIRRPETLAKAKARKQK